MWPANCPVEGNRETWRGRCALLAVTAIGAIVWLAVLPWVAEQPAVRETIERNERLGVDPAAKFYTELPCMPALFQRVDSSLHRRPERLLTPPPPPR